MNTSTFDWINGLDIAVASFLATLALMGAAVIYGFWRASRRPR